MRNSVVTNFTFTFTGCLGWKVFIANKLRKPIMLIGLMMKGPIAALAHEHKEGEKVYNPIHACAPYAHFMLLNHRADFGVIYVGI